MAPNPSDTEGLQNILQITRLMAATMDLDGLLGLIIDSSMELLDAERASLLLYDPDTDELDPQDDCTVVVIPRQIVSRQSVGELT